MKVGLLEGQVWPLAMDAKGYPDEVALPMERVARYLNRLNPAKRQATIDRLKREGYDPPCPLLPRVLFADDWRHLPEHALDGFDGPVSKWKRLPAEEQMVHAHELETGRMERRLLPDPRLPKEDD
jgi:hypothetical protein